MNSNNNLWLRLVIPVLLLTVASCGGGGGGGEGGGGGNNGGGVTAVSPPSGLSYPGPTVVTVGAAVTLSPTVSGGAVSSWSVSPALPVGLALSAANGNLSGTPTAASSRASYTVTASNAGGTVTYALELTVQSAAPSGLTYPTPINGTAGTALSVAPTLASGTATSWSIAPALPGGLALDATTGVIAGAPLSAAALSTYTVTAGNAAGSTTFALNLVVAPVAPSALSYPNPQSLTTESTVNLSPTVSGQPSSFSVSPSLPTGLTLNAATGVISGTPSVGAPPRGYFITATNSAGSTTFTLQMAITLLAPKNFTLTLTTDVKQMHFAWAPQASATEYEILTSTIPGLLPSQFWTWSGVLAPGTASYDATVLSRMMWQQVFTMRACNGAGCGYSNVIDSSTFLTSLVGYLKASNARANGFFGESVAMSEDGEVVAIGSSGESSGATGINGNPNDQSAPLSGAVYVFTRSPTGAWAQSAYLKASNAQAGDAFGNAVALNFDGTVLAVGALGEASSGTGLTADPANNDRPYAGAVYMFRANDQRVWTQESYLKASVVAQGDYFGQRLSLSVDGSTLAVGAPYARSGAGNVFIFKHVNGAPSPWTQYLAPLVPTISDAGDAFGSDVSLSANGNSLLAGAYCEASASVFSGALNPSNNAAACAGAAYLFEMGPTGYFQSMYFKASNTGAGDFFGTAVELSRSGDMVLVGAPREASNGQPADNSVPNAGAVYVYRRTGGGWVQPQYLKGSGSASLFGSRIKLDGTATQLFISAPYDNSSNLGPFRTFPPDQQLLASGAVYQFVPAVPGSTDFASYLAVLKAPNAGVGDSFGQDLAIDGIAASMVISASYESGNGTGQQDDSAQGAGAAYLY